MGARPHGRLHLASPCANLRLIVGPPARGEAMLEPGSLELAQEEARAEQDSAGASPISEGSGGEATVGADDPAGTDQGRDGQRDLGASGGAEDPIGTVEGTEGPVDTADRSGQRSGLEIERCVEDLAKSVWGLVNDLQAEQARRVGELVKSVSELRQQAARLSKWDDAADRLRQRAERAKCIVADAKCSFNAAVESAIKAAHLDLLGGSDLGRGGPQERRGWRFWRRT